VCELLSKSLASNPENRTDEPWGKDQFEGPKNDVRRSTRLSRQIPVVITSLDPAGSFSGKYDTVVVNAHGCGVIVRERLDKETPLTVELLSNGRSKKARVAVVISLAKGASWLLGIEFDSPGGDFWGIENPPADWQV
jgi:hypothetical protein